MTCRAARRLLPLFAGGDLKASKTSAVAGHVAACAACRAEVEAFTEVRSLLPLSSLSFGESERAMIRRCVLDEMANRGSSSPFVSFLLRPRFALAALAGVVVLAASLVSPLFVRNAVEPEAVLHVRSIPSAIPIPPETRIADTRSLLPDRPAAIFPSPIAKRAPPLPSKNPGPAVRLEIQTGNVNVRIIWFTGGDPASEAPFGPTSDANVS